MLEKDKHERYSESRQVETMLRGMNTTDAGLEAAKAQFFHSMQHTFDKASEFMLAYISNRHSAAQHDYANCHGANGMRRYGSATGSDGDRGGRGRGQSGRSGEQGGRGGRGCCNGRATRTYNNNVDVTDPHRNFASIRLNGRSSARCDVS